MTLLVAQNRTLVVLKQCDLYVLESFYTLHFQIFLLPKYHVFIRSELVDISITKA